MSPTTIPTNAPLLDALLNAIEATLLNTSLVPPMDFGVSVMLINTEYVTGLQEAYDSFCDLLDGNTDHGAA
jgi:hypothetical protein